MDDLEKVNDASEQEMQEFKATARREFLAFLAASPCIAALGGARRLLQQSTSTFPTQNSATAPAPVTPAGGGELITDPAAALDVFDFEEVCHQKIQQGHWAYMVSGVDMDATLRANREGFSHVKLRPRRLRDVSKVDTKVDLFGTTYDSPIYTCPTGGEKGFWSDGELSVARAAKARGTMQMLSSVTSTGVEEVNQALGRPVWYQLYAPTPWEACQKLIERVAASGCTVLVLTVDANTGRNSETNLRLRPKDLKQCTVCHEGPAGPSMKERPMFAPLVDIPNMRGQSPAMDWAYSDQMRKLWKGKFVIKGILTREDARLSIEHGFDGIVVSNHGGRATETEESTIETLPEIITEVNNRAPVFVDGGFRRGTDVFKALAMGAKGVGIGRPMLWGLGAFGEAGVDRVLAIMQRELKLVMGNCGTATIADITRDYISTPAWKT